MSQDTPIVNQDAKNRLTQLLSELSSTVSNGNGKSKPLTVNGINVNSGKVQNINLSTVNFSQPLVVNGQVTNTLQEVGKFENLHVESKLDQNQVNSMQITEGKVTTKGIALKTRMEFGIRLYIKIGCKKIRTPRVTFRKTFTFRNFSDFSMDLSSLDNVNFIIDSMDAPIGFFKIGSVNNINFPAYLFGIGAENTKIPTAGFATSDLIVGRLNASGVDVPNTNTDTLSMESFFPENGMKINNATILSAVADGIKGDITALNVPLRLEGKGAATPVFDGNIGPFGVTLDMFPVFVNIDVDEMKVDDAVFEVKIDNAKVGSLFTPISVHALKATGADLSGLHIANVSRTVV